MNPNYLKGKGIAPPERPVVDAPFKDFVRYQIIKTLNQVSELNLLTTTDLAERTGISRVRILKFRYRPDSPSRAIPTITELVGMFKTFNKRNEYFPTGLHGRRFNYVQIFRDGEEFTEYEEELMQEIEQLKQELEALKQKLPHV